MLRNIVLLLVIAGAGYWYWSSQGPDARRAAEQQRLEENSRQMQRCINRERSMNAAAGLGGAGGMGGVAEDAKALCAEKLGLYFAEGQWQKLGVGDDYVGD